MDIFEYLVKESEAIKGQLRNHKSFDTDLSYSKAGITVRTFCDKIFHSKTQATETLIREESIDS